MKFIILCASLICVVTSPLSAQSNTEPEPASAKKPRGLVLKTLCAAYQRNIREVEIAVGKDERLKFPLYDDAFSPPQGYRPRTPLRIFKVGEEKPFATVTPSSYQGELILLFVPTGETDSPYRVLSMNSSKDGFKYGTRRMFNFTKRDVAVRYGKTSHLIPKGAKFKDVRILPKEKNGERFAIEFFEKLGKNWKRFSATRWSAKANKRSILIFYTDPRTHLTSYRSVSEFLIDETLVQQRHAQGVEKANKDGVKPNKGIGEDEKIRPNPTGGKGKTAPPIPLKR